MKNYLYFMRLSLTILVAVQLNRPANCQTLLNENFDYVAGTNLTSNGWNAHSGTGTNPVKVDSTGLSFPGYPSSDIGLSALLAKDGEDVNKTFTTVSSGDVFCAFLVQIDAIDSGYFLHMAGTPFGTNYKARVFINGTGNSFSFGFSKGTETPVYTVGSPFITGLTYLLVLKYSIVEGVSNDAVSLYIITGSVPAREPSMPTIGPLTDGQSDLANVSAIALRQYSNKQKILIDGIRVATKWEDAVGVMTGNEDLSATDNPILYPVPVSEELRLSNILNVTMIEIYDLSGRKIISVKKETPDVVKIPVKQLSPGLYIIRLKTSVGIKTMKFIKS